MPAELARILERLGGLGEGFVEAAPGLLVAVLVFVAFAFLARVIGLAVERLTQRRGRTRNAGRAVGRLVQGGVLLVGILVALSLVLPTFRPGDVVEILGLGGVAIGLVFRDVLQNFLAGILLLLTQPFRIGDQIVVEGLEGTVDDIQTRATFLTTYDNRRVLIPNAKMLTDTVVVHTAFPLRRIEYDVGIGYGDDPEEARRLVLRALRDVDVVLADPAPDVLVMDYGPSALVLRVRWWVEPPRRADALDSRDKVLTAIRRILREHGIDMPFPTQQVLLHDQTEETDGDRARQREGWPAGRSGVPAPRTIAGALAEAAPDGAARGGAARRETDGRRAS